ncbi:MAG: AbrB/MazE/SpoVT family DNA-binding domain-containing protein [Deltaproteobacteria bacterium]|nr:AbrB/MazE/SpoVT family DNA-binding domain-containing protein [Deltaproteobacteria bacterium]
MALVKVLRHGQVTLPKEFRDILGISEGDLMEAELDGTRILFKPKAVVDKGASPPAAAAAEQQAWGKLSARQLERAYGEAEPDYSSNLIKEPNPEYQP